MHVGWVVAVVVVVLLVGAAITAIVQARSELITVLES